MEKEPLLCPLDGTELVPSRLIPTEEWFECPRCGALIGEPDWKNKYDLGEMLLPFVDFDPDPARAARTIASALELKGGASKGGRKRKKIKGFGRPRWMEGSTVLPVKPKV